MSNVLKAVRSIILAVCLPAYLSVHLSMAVCLAVSVLCSLYSFCRPVLLDYLVAQVAKVPDHMGDTFVFSKYVGSCPASTLYPKNIRNIRHILKYFKISNPKNIFQFCTLTL